jgi:hypothetical protein
MRRSLTALLVLVAIAALPAGAAADEGRSSALGGGRYEGRVDAPCDRTCTVLLLTVDDGRSLMTDSGVGAPCQPAGTSSGFTALSPRGTPVRSDGSFRWRGRFQAVEGRFSADGRTVSGTARWLGPARSDCGSETTTFSARLVRRAKPDGTCEPLRKGRVEVRVLVRRTGCTKATRVVDAWRLDRDCVTTSLDLRPCRAAGRRCTPVDGGRLQNLAGVACRAGRSEIELVIREGCPLLMARRLSLRVINVSCAAAARVARSWASRSDCSRRACTVAGWSCRHVASSRPAWTCRRTRQAFELNAPPVGGDGDG